MNTFNTLTLLAASETEGGEEAAEGIASLGLDPIQIAFQAGVFVILFILLKKFAFKKITDTLNDRHETIEEGLANAQKAAAQLEESTAEQAEMLKQARKEADAVIAKAHEETGIMVKEAEERAQAKSEKIVADAQSKIEADVAKAKKDLKKELAALVADATETVIGEKMTADIDKKMIEKAIQ